MFLAVSLDKITASKGPVGKTGGPKGVVEGQANRPLLKRTNTPIPSALQSSIAEATSNKTGAQHQRGKSESSSATNVATPSKWEQRVQGVRDYLNFNHGKKDNPEMLTKQTGGKPQETTSLTFKKTEQTARETSAPSRELILDPIMNRKNSTQPADAHFAQSTPTWSNLPQRTMDRLFQKSQGIKSPQEANAFAQGAVQAAAEAHSVSGHAVTPTQKTQLQALVASASNTIQSGWNALQFKAWAESLSSAIAQIVPKSRQKTTFDWEPKKTMVERIVKIVEKEQKPPIDDTFTNIF